MVQSLMLGDLTGFAALASVGASASIMALRGKVVRALGSEALRTVHVSVSIMAVVFLSAHIALLFYPPVTLPLDLGYGAFVLGAVLWSTGIGFLERNKDSFFLHGSLALALVALVVAHAAASGVTIPSVVSVPALLAAGFVALASASYNVRKLRTRPRAMQHR